MREALKVFAMKMETRLAEKDDEKGSATWLEEDYKPVFVTELHDRMLEKVEQINHDISDCAVEKIEKRCIDVANYAMMISDRIRNRNNASA